MATAQRHDGSWWKGARVVSDRQAEAEAATAPATGRHADQGAGDLRGSSSALALFVVFRHRNYRLFFAGQLVSLMGTWMQNVAQAWLVYSMTRSPFLLGLTSFAAQVTVFFVAPFGGMVADRVDRRRMLLLTQSLAMVQASLLAGLTLAGVVRVWEIVALAFGLGLINAFDMPTRQAMTLDMVGREDLRHAIALNSMMFNLARVVGPSVAGAVIAVVGEGPCFTLNALSFAAVLTSLAFMRLPARPPRTRTTAMREISEGYRFSWRTPQIRTSLMLVAVSSCFGAAYVSLMPAFARDVLHGDAGTYGTLMAGVGAGALVGAYGLSRIHERWLTLAPVVAALCLGPGLVAFSHSHRLWLSILVLLPTSASLMLLGGTTNTMIQILAGERYRGRVISHYTQSFMGMMPWGSLLLGYVARRCDVTHAVTFGGLVVVASAAFAWMSRRGQSWRFDETAPER
jgi:MFS family permease